MLGRSFQTPNAIDSGERPASRPSRNRRVMKSGENDGDLERESANAHHTYEDDENPLLRRKDPPGEKLVGQNQHGSTGNVALSSRRLKGTKILMDDYDNKSNKEEGLDQQQKQQQQQRLPSKHEGVNSDDTEEKTKKKKKKKKKKQGKPKEGTDDTEEAEEGEEAEDVDPREHAVKILSEMNEQYEDDATMLSSHSESISSLVHLQVRLLDEKKRWNNTGRMCTLLFFMLPSLVLLVFFLLVRMEESKTYDRAKQYRALYCFFALYVLTGICLAIIMCIAAWFQDQQHQHHQQRQHQNRNNNKNNNNNNNNNNNRSLSTEDGNVESIDNDTILLDNDDDSSSSYYSVFRPSMWGTRTHNRRTYQDVPANLAPTRDCHDIEAAESSRSLSHSLNSLSIPSATKDVDSMLNIMIMAPSTRNSILSPPAPTEEAAAAATTSSTTTTTIQNNSKDIEHSQRHGDEDYDQEEDGNLYQVDLGS